MSAKKLIYSEQLRASGFVNWWNIPQVKELKKKNANQSPLALLRHVGWFCLEDPAPRHPERLRLPASLIDRDLTLTWTMFSETSAYSTKWYLAFPCEADAILAKFIMD